MDRNFIMLKEVRCSFPRLYGTEVKDGDTFGPGIAVVLEAVKHGKVILAIKDAMRAAIAGNPKLVSNPPPPDKMCLKKPDRDELKYLAGNIVLKANNTRAPIVLHADGVTVMTEATDLVYSGCYVNVKIEIWGQANKYGRRVNAKVIAVQYVPKAASSFDGSYVSPEEAVQDFDSLDDDGSLGVGEIPFNGGSESIGSIVVEDDLLG